MIRGTLVSESLRVGAEAQAYALGLGVPAAQIDWPE
jgi:hypothetical protein